MRIIGKNNLIETKRNRLSHCDKNDEVKLDFDEVRIYNPIKS
jgi:hypothetical protein